MIKRLHRLSSRQKGLNPWENRGDFVLLITTVILVVFGLLMVYDASVVQAYRDFGDNYYYAKQQLVWASLGLVSLSICSFLDYHLWKKFALLGFLGSFFLLLAVFIPGLGVEAGGAHRWLKIFGFTLQPAEIIKLTSVIFLATLFEKEVRDTPFFIIMSIIFVVLGLLQRDLGSAIVYLLTLFCVYLVAGGKLKNILTMIPLGILGFVIFILISEYRRKRILAFLDPFFDPQNYSYHISQVLIALGSGGWLGVGLGQSRQKFEFIPEVTTDSIFAIIGEELGFIGAVSFIIIYSFFILRGFKIAQNCQDNFGRILAFGLMSWLGIQAVINLGAMVALFPLTGVPLPFISYGGSAIFTSLTAVGILLNISKNISVPFKA